MLSRLDKAAVRIEEFGSGPRLAPGSVLFFGFLATFVAAVPLGLARAALPWPASTAGMAVVVAAVSWRARWGAAASTAGLAWLMLNGFVVHQYGDLGWDGRRDVVRLVALLFAALTAAGTRALVAPTPRSRSVELIVPAPRSAADNRAARP